MQPHVVRGRSRALADDEGHAAPTPLFLAFLGALVLAALLTLHDGFDEASLLDFLLLATIVTVCVLVAFGGLLVWSARAGQRAAALAALRPGAVVVRGTCAPGLRGAARALQAERSMLAFGLTLLADDTGLEMWAGPAEQPARLGRVPWEAVDEVRTVRVTRFGRVSNAIEVSVRNASGQPVEVPFAVIGAGIGGLFAPCATTLDALVAELSGRRDAACARD